MPSSFCLVVCTCTFHSVSCCVYLCVPGYVLLCVFVLGFMYCCVWLCIWFIFVWPLSLCELINLQVRRLSVRFCA